MIELGIMLGLLGLVLLIIATPICIFSDKSFAFKVTTPIIGSILFISSIVVISNPLNQMSAHPKMFPLQIFRVDKSEITINVNTARKVTEKQLYDILATQGIHAKVVYYFKNTPQTITEYYETLQDLSNNLKAIDSSAKVNKTTGIHVTFIEKNNQIYQADFETATEVPKKLTSKNLSQKEAEYARAISWDNLIYTNETPVQIVTHWSNHSQKFDGTLLNGKINIK